MTAREASGEAARRRADRDERIKEALSLGFSYGQTADEVVGVSVRTIARLMADLEFSRDVWERRAWRSCRGS
jgi:hypothetical protein